VAIEGRGLAHGAVGSMVAQLAREAGTYVIDAGRAADRQRMAGLHIPVDAGVAAAFLR
jgi:NADPH-dependent curcumin reductase CurA